MGKSHVTSGWVTGALIGHGLNALPQVTIPAAGVCALGIVAAGASALNDLDHPNASASRMLGPVSGLLSMLVQFYARLMYRATRGPGDPLTRGAHRGATHALPLLLLPCALLAVLPQVAHELGGMVAVVGGKDPAVVVAWSQRASLIVIGGVLVFCVLLAVDRLGYAALVAAGVAFVGLLAGGWVGTDPVGQLVVAAPWIALAVLVGTVTHVLGDWVTEYGLYALAPLYRRNRGTSRERRWVRLALPKWLAFRTNGWFERWVVFRLLLVPSAVVVVPGVWPVVLALFTS